MITLQQARSSGCLLYECLAGSRAYGTDLPGSDTDLRGVFVAPIGIFYGLDPVEQLSAEDQDEIYYEIGRFISLLCRNNPTVIEILFAGPELTRHQHPLWSRIDPRLVLSKWCLHSFAGYAVSQVNKARGLNKKIVNPQPSERRQALDFCHVVEGQGSIPLATWLENRGMRSGDCGLVKVPHLKGVYAIFHDPSGRLGYRGIFGEGPDATEPRTSSVPRNAQPEGWMQYNQDGFQRHCKEHRDYQEWVQKRNPERHRTNTAHGRNYDSKNLMHTFRLLGMASEIATTGKVTVQRPDREFLLRIRRGEFSYEDLMAMAGQKLGIIEQEFARSDLPEEPDRQALEQVLVEIRQEWYRR